MRSDIEMRMDISIRQSVVRGGLFVEARETPCETDELRKAEETGKIFSILPYEVVLYPKFAFSQGRLVDELADVIAILASGGRSPWSMAAWFISVNGYLGGQSPAEMLQLAPLQVVAAARREVAGIQHG